METILIKNGRVWDGEGFLYTDILTEGGVITRIEPSISCEKAFVYNAAGLTVAPGLVDAHTHLRGISSSLYGAQAEATCFPFGVTAAVDAGAEQGSQALLDSFMVKNAVFVCTEIKNNQPDLQSAELLLSRYGEKSLGLKIYFSGSQIKDTLPLEQLCRFAHARGLSVMVHCNGSPVSMSAILDVLEPGDILTHAFHGGRNSAAADHFESMKAAQKRGVWIDAGFAGHVHTDFSILRSAVEAGMIPDIISTDITIKSAFTRGGRYGMTMCMSMARTVGIKEEDIFRGITTTPAAALNKAGEWGRLAVDRAADIAVFDYTGEGFLLKDKAGNCLESKNGYRCLLTIADGQIVYRH